MFKTRELENLEERISRLESKTLALERELHGSFLTSPEYAVPPMSSPLDLYFSFQATAATLRPPNFISIQEVVQEILNYFKLNLKRRNSQPAQSKVYLEEEKQKEN